MGGEIITFWTGQCGVQLASACWELYTLEHCIGPDGKLLENSGDDDVSFEKFFKEVQNGQFVPRSILIDLEPSVVDEIRVGMYRKLFNPETLINSSEDAANNFARGFYSCGREIIKNVVQATRKMAEHSTSVQAFIIHHSFGGGTGSGFTSMLIEYLSIEYAKRTKIEFGIFPSATLSVSVVEPYNTILALHTPMENADLAAFFENESIFRICQNNLDSTEINYTVINRIIAQVMSGTTASLRFEGPINANVIDFQTNLVPFPRIHFPLISFCPIVAPSRIEHSNLSTQEITEQVFMKDNQMSEVNPMEGAYMSCCLLYRGHINIIDANSTINHLKTNWSMPWVDWCPTGFKVGINYQPMLAIPGCGIGYSERAVCLLCNTTSIKSVIKRVNKKFLHLYSKKAFVHWYVLEGMEESEFSEAFEDVLMLEKDYEIIESTASNEPNESDMKTNILPSIKTPNSVTSSSSPVKKEKSSIKAHSKTITPNSYISQSKESEENYGIEESYESGYSEEMETNDSNQNKFLKIIRKSTINSTHGLFESTLEEIEKSDASISFDVRPFDYHNSSNKGNTPFSLNKKSINLCLGEQLKKEGMNCISVEVNFEDSNDDLLIYSKLSLK